MEQSTKLFVTLAFMFLIFTTLNGNLEKYLRIVFGTCPAGCGKTSSSSGGLLGSILGAVETAAPYIAAAG